MLSGKNLLRKKRDFEEILRRGKGLKGNLVILKFKKKELGDSRIGFIVSKKVSKKAVARNRIKRRCREAVKNLLPKIKKSFDIVLIALPAVIVEEPNQLKIEIEELFLKAKISK